MASDPCIMLVDNGSTRAATTLNLRRLTAKLSTATGFKVHPVSLLHSDRIGRERLEGIPAQILEPFLAEQRGKNVSSFLLLPLFFGHSAAIFEYIPQRLRELRKGWPELEMRIAPCLVNPDDPGDTDVAEIIARIVRCKITVEELQSPAITLVDHGTPRIAVNEVRNLVCAQLKNELGGKFGPVKASSMERREGSEYNFNEPLLENLLGSSGFDGDVVVALLFNAPGRHAGKDGDITQICARAESSNEGLRTFISDPFTSDDGALKLLAKRLRQGLSGKPVTDDVRRD